ncbi:hypothetical protein D3C74_276200 [compost metagenome]
MGTVSSPNSPLVRIVVEEIMPIEIAVAAATKRRAALTTEVDIRELDPAIALVFSLPDGILERSAEGIGLSNRLWTEGASVSIEIAAGIPRDVTPPKNKGAITPRMAEFTSVSCSRTDEHSSQSFKCSWVLRVFLSESFPRM